MNAKWMAAGLIVVGALGSSAYAASQHFKGDPTVRIGTDTVSVKVCFSGLGNENGAVLFDGAGQASIECTNHGQHYVPPQDTTFDLSGEVDFDASATKNGNLCVTKTFTVTADDASDAGCPNDNWTANVVGISLDYLTVELQQPVGTTVLGPTNIL